MTYDSRDQVLALAGVFQASVLAQQLARRGYEDEPPFVACVRSVFITDAINTASIFGGEEGVELGLKTMSKHLSSSGKQADLDIARYVLGLIQLGLRLRRDGSTARRISDEIDRLKASAGLNNGGGLNDAVYGELARVYQDTISNLKPRIIVQGEHGHLSTPLVIDKVRTALFAGVRAAFLWHQVGGRRWHLVIRRKQTLAVATSVLSELGGR